MWFFGIYAIFWVYAYFSFVLNLPGSYGNFTMVIVTKQNKKKKLV